HLSTPLIRLFLLVLILLLMPTLNFLPVWFALSLLRFRLPSRLPMMFILWMVAKIGRASCRERVWFWRGAGSIMEDGQMGSAALELVSVSSRPVITSGRGAGTVRMA